VVYELTAEGKEHLHAVLASAGPAAWEDDNFDVRFALFAQTDAETRLRVLEGRRARLTERLEAFRESTTHPRSRLDEYALELRRFGLERVEREVHWLDSLISTERGRAAAPNRPSQQEQTKERG
jgi:DNA-binding PadR family transcriptional regulator